MDQESSFHEGEYKYYMTYKKALQILIECGKRDIDGCGVGLRPDISEKQRNEIRIAIKKVSPKVYEWWEEN